MLKSWDKYALPGLKRVVITKDNCSDYIEILEHVLRKVEEGKLVFANFSDIVRVVLLYRYGGIWLDSTIMLNDYMPEECWCREYDIYTKNIKSTEFATKTSWSIWFLYAKRGVPLNNVQAMDLMRHLNDEYCEEKYFEYIKGVFFRSLPDMGRIIVRIPCMRKYLAGGCERIIVL